ncbi:hypothetical protein VTN00DRAFT_4849 [Thermoascus crustaceus]|uniref:uncharacterized protein n=1 Tax=Thermoascus crustaceus TaxID=5088 RepID=UPI0037433F88
MRLLIQQPLCTLSSLRLRSCLPSRFAVFRSSTRRLYSSARVPSSIAYAEESVEVPVGGNGYVSLSVLRPVLSLPPQPTHSSVILPLDSARPCVILYLPPGPLFQQRSSYSKDSRIGDGGNGSIGNRGLPPQHVLASTTLCTVVTVNYRLGQVVTTPEQPKYTTEEKENDSVVTKAEAKAPPSYKYPTPIHDTLAGFDWIRGNLNPEQLCVFGTHIGGSLALMLALTEPKTVHAVAAREPVCDWVGLDEYCTTPQLAEVAVAGGGDDTEIREETNVQLQQAGKSTPWRNTQRRAAPPDLVPLLEAREKFFLSAERYFDAFASPILFLRSASMDVPKAFPKYHTGPEYPVPVLKTPELLEEPLDLWDIDMQPEDLGFESDSGDSTAEEKPVRRMKALSRWPPFGLDYDSSPATRSAFGPSKLKVTLPWVRVFVPSRRGKKRTVLARQAEEMVSVMRRACFFGLEKGFGENRVKLIQVPESADPAAIEEAGKWFREVLEEEEEEGEVKE